MTNMKNTHKIVKIGAAVALGLSQIALVTLPVYAAVGSTTLGARLDAIAGHFSGLTPPFRPSPYAMRYTSGI